MATERKGICVAGTTVVDTLYPIERWPKEGQLTSIQEGIERSTGGLVNNVIVDLARLDGSLPLTALGVIGPDAEGDYIIQELSRYPNIDTSQLDRSGITSFTAVMSSGESKSRTFFHYRGANAVFDERYVHWEALQHVKILHIGYILLLDSLDAEDGEYGTRMARLLHDAKARGIKTSIDVVSETGDRFQRIVTPALKHTDYCIINEIEAGQTTGIPLRDDSDRLIEGNIPKALQRMRELGVSEWAVIHCPEGGYGLDAEGNYTALQSLPLPKGYIKGTVGAGDAFCAGAIYAAHQGMGLEAGIQMGIAAAACSLSENDASSGMRSAGEAMALYRSLR